ncbi:hypothetical protein GCM10011491_05640 [Brucella endophytica]|uniref:Phage gp6-like head-tail connector protein n=1 Tax=Brucella endophytica TaxID=1963359 RepID=A0A916S391_9HYPH|nr:head-tail connector protein [Brucella endophytica]GGA81239.1 hypothetical protein GCM10011491_05640 [Brucella endophytica]
MVDTITLEGLKAQLNFTPDMGVNDDALLERKLAAALDHVERLLGFRIDETYGAPEQQPVPPSLIEAIYQLAAHWYENREASIVGVNAQEVPFGVRQIVNEYRDWSF